MAAIATSGSITAAALAAIDAKLQCMSRSKEVVVEVF
jgi:hypothetical protein